MPDEQSMTPENQRDEDLKRYDSKYGHFIKWDDFIAQRQSWEREKAGLREIIKTENGKVNHYIDKSIRLEAEKKGLEERVREYKTEWESALYREQGLKSRNEELGAREYQLRDNIERAYADAKRINPDYDWEGLTQTAQIAVCGLESLILRLKAKVAELEAEKATLITSKLVVPSHPEETFDKVLDVAKENNRLKAENERLAKESERRKFLLKECEKESKFRGEEIAHLKESRSKWAKQSSENADEIDRLTSALAMAHEALKGIMYKRIKDNDALEFAEYVLADKEGTLAFEKWKKIVEAVEQFVQCGECSTCSCCLDIGKEALEALDAKGEME